MKQQLDPKAVWMFAISSFFTWLFVILILGVQGAFIFEEIGLLQLGFAFWAPIILIVPFVVAWAYGVLSYKFYFYELTDDGFRKESGIIWKRYTTIPYERIQNVDIHRGIIARILGLSDLQVQTAGSSAMYNGSWGMSGAGAEGRLPGLSRETAEKLRDELVRRSKTARTSGL
ncbi:hypothetical protein A3C18_02155 [Candidatus Kaiserbacteria bacterium RIFCSPHIGHO2_02_FULL_54_11b]|uniref:YdbS-like PH domain-containing protein n=2 Tax=Candidatus Kaiseribacteriota TaxID=1752734 RepID=A0A1F6CJR3_9BACT|nr:MAG: hypothetical protein A2704_04955 [Candidatus Kaiserbacteria bacterium RIFCSPHIGHO2_01_FULL_54_36b]OGG63830.1 MAG: hypothetical protein A3C18_02155 [Candidatus Kaiserbacteria bacterium RIFCSPHIGHO2_02_FULL_54_11b]